MNYQNEFLFLKRTAEKLKLRYCSLAKNVDAQSLKEIGAEYLLKASERFNLSLLGRFSKAEENVIYKVSDPFGATVIFFLLPHQPKETVFCIGPFLCEGYTSESFLEKAEKLSLTQDIAQIERYYQGLPLLEDSSHFYAVLDSFFELIFEGENYSFLSSFSDNFDSLIKREQKDSSTEEDIRIMEERYAFEDEFMRCISNGLTNKVEMFLTSFSASVYEKRLSDPLRNAKNYAIIMNTLCRKAAQAGGVHPVYLNSISSDFARKIEAIKETSEIQALMMQMYRSYCRLVKKHSMKNFSPPVQKAIIHIDSDLSGDLSLKNIAKSLNLSEGYLSALFSKEVGSTLSEFVNQKRIKYARHLLTTTSLQIQTVAMHCGFPDVHYFSKVFKKLTSSSPLEFRKNNI